MAPPTPQANQPIPPGLRPRVKRPGSMRDAMWDWIRDPANRDATLGDLARHFGVPVSRALAIRDGGVLDHGTGCGCVDCAVDAAL